VNTLIAAESLKPLAAGCRLQEFVIERVLGMGGFGVVYLAQDTLLNRTVAIKEYMPNHMVSRIDGLTVTLKSESFAQDFETV
jgi:serine/threonine protein kinase